MREVLMWRVVRLASFRTEAQGMAPGAQGRTTKGIQVMRNVFRRRRPEPVQPVTTQADIITAHAWQLTLTQWWALTDHDRAECRRTVTVAPNFGRAS
jgi:hypothetical protein